MFMHRKKNSHRNRAVHSLPGRRLRLEALESRDMMAGDVTYSLVANGAVMDLLLQGDNNSDGVVLTQSTSVPGEFTLSSTNNTQFQAGAAGVPTSSPPPILGVTGAVVVDLGNGNTSFTLNGAGNNQALPGGLEILNGNGTDTVALNTTIVPGNLSQGTASLLIDNSPAVAADLIDGATANTGGGTVTVTATTVTVSGSDGLVINDGAGSNTATLSGVIVSGSLAVQNQAAVLDNQVNVMMNQSSLVTGTTDIDATGVGTTKGAGGATAEAVTINNSSFNGVFTLTTNLGSSVLNVTGSTTTFGTPPLPPGVSIGALPTDVVITNENTLAGGVGGTSVNFGVANGQTTGATIYGSVSIANGPTLATNPSAFNNVVFTGTTVLGGVQVSNGSTTGATTPVGFSTSQVTFTGAVGTGIGTQLAMGGLTVAGTQMGAVLPGKIWSVAVNNGPGPDTFNMTGLNAPDGVAVFNGGSGNGGTLGVSGSSNTLYSGNTIGSNINVEGLGHDALDIGLDNGTNHVTVQATNALDQNVKIGAVALPITGTEIVNFAGGNTTNVAGTLSLLGGSGTNNFTLGSTTVAGLIVTTTGGVNTVLLQGSTVTNTLTISFGGATSDNTLQLYQATGGTANTLPSNLTGLVTVTLAAGSTNDLDYDAADATAALDVLNTGAVFSLIVP